MKVTKKPQIGGLAGIKDPEIKKALQNFKEVIETSVGSRGQFLDRNPTWRQLTDAGFKFDGNGNLIGIDIGGPGGGTPSGGAVTIPPAPTGFEVVGGYSFIFLKWDAPTFSNYAYTEVVRSATNNLGSATKIGTSDGRTYVDAPGVASPNYFYWVRFVTEQNNVGNYNAVSGTPGKTALDPDYVASVLTEKINNSTNATVQKFTDFFGIQDAGDPSGKYLFLIGNVAGVPSIVLNASTFVGDLTIKNAMVQTLAADKLFAATGTIAEAIIGTADITNAMIANVIQSNNWVPGSSGWIINKSGYAEFQDIFARGDIEASSIKAGSANIINTLMLQGQAVTFPQSKFTAAYTGIDADVGASTYGYGDYITAQTLTFTKTSAPTMVFLCANGYVQDKEISYGQFESNPRGICGIEYIAEISPTPSGYSNPIFETQNVLGERSATADLTTMLLLNAPAGTYTINLRLRVVVFAYPARTSQMSARCYIRNRLIMTLELKR